MHHIGHAGYIPRGQGLIEGLRVVEHVKHIGHAGHVPCGQGLVEGERSVEHALHIGDAGHIPCADVVVEVAVRGTRFHKMTHVVYAAGVPVRMKRRNEIRG